ncbi:putative ArsR family transcriptional regulator [Mesorhizobium soli]|uniref:helix-turn-helix transcriptional regulator n=1 Tax=Pseudaminobacter soli (ex Li et al. 2025) TaxID=1295366 RepID=UPI0024735668|nr:transcriptional regulator [Mesorhizobium soli]MDH6233609.1 putative ArsR family transcriptional regulator [Mesorhizobium soli]
MPDISPGEDRILRLLKFRGDQTTAAIAIHLDITAPGARKHLNNLLENDLVGFEDRAGRVGRPERYWRLTDEAQKRFPDSHAVLTVEMLDSVRGLFGEDGLDRLIGERERQMLRRYDAALAGLHGLGERVAALAEIRLQEGYLAEAEQLPGGAWLLAENHCPICAAASSCRNFCRSELALFRQVLGDDVSVERIDYILEGARRCAYRIQSASEGQRT